MRAMLAPSRAAKRVLPGGPEPRCGRRALHSSPLCGAASRKSPTTDPRPPPPQRRPLPAGHPRAAPRPAQHPDFSRALPLPTLVRYYKYPFFGAALAAGLLGAYASYLAASLLGPAPPPAAGHPHADPGPSALPSEPAAPTGLPPRAPLNRIEAAAFDAGLDWPERLMGLTRLRRRLARDARGHVLEVAVGTGRNLAFYDWDDVADRDPPRRALRQLEKRRRWGSVAAANDHDGVSPELTTYTGVDIAPAVLDVARAKLRAAVPGGQAAIAEGRGGGGGGAPDGEGGGAEVLRAFGGKVRLIRCDAQQPLPAAPAGYTSAGDTATATTTAGSSSSSRSSGGGYDTVVQTFGLCSVADPQAVLASLAGAVRPGTGRILLLEHGRGRAGGVVNKLLDRYSGRHFERFGCWWNRDIEGLVRAAAARVPGLEVVRVDRPGWLQFGTTIFVELRVRPDGEGGGGGGGVAKGGA